VDRQVFPDFPNNHFKKQPETIRDPSLRSSSRRPTNPGYGSHIAVFLVGQTQISQVHAAARRFFRPPPHAALPLQTHPPVTPSSAQKAVDAPATLEKLSKVGSFGTAQNRIEPWHPPLFRCFAQLLLLSSFLPSSSTQTKYPSKVFKYHDLPLKQTAFSFPFFSPRQSHLRTLHIKSPTHHTKWLPPSVSIWVPRTLAWVSSVRTGKFFIYLQI
jgi:hypothetical protein